MAGNGSYGKRAGASVLMIAAAMLLALLAVVSSAWPPNGIGIALSLAACGALALALSLSAFGRDVPSQALARPARDEPHAAEMGQPLHFAIDKYVELNRLELSEVAAMVAQACQIVQIRHKRGLAYREITAQTVRVWQEAGTIVLDVVGTTYKVTVTSQQDSVPTAVRSSDKFESGPLNLTDGVVARAVNLWQMGKLLAHLASLTRVRADDRLTRIVQRATSIGENRYPDFMTMALALDEYAAWRSSAAKPADVATPSTHVSENPFTSILARDLTPIPPSRATASYHGSA